jgi:hypothetical protein
MMTSPKEVMLMVSQDSKRSEERRSATAGGLLGVSWGV